MRCVRCGASAYWTSIRTRSAICSRCCRSRSRTAKSSSWCSRLPSRWCFAGSPGRCAANCIRRSQDPRRGPMRGCAQTRRRRHSRVRSTRARKATRCAWHACARISPPPSPPCRRRYSAPLRAHVGSSRRGAHIPAERRIAPRATAYAARFSRVFRNLISGQRSSVNPRFTRVGARYTSSPA